MLAMQRILMLLLCGLCSSFPCRAEPLHVYCDNWPGFCQTDGTGFYPDLVKAIYQPHGYVIVPHIVPYKRALFMVTKNKKGMALGVYEDELQNVRLPEYPDSADDLSVMMLEEWLHQWHGELTLAGQQVLWPRGWAQEKSLSVTVHAHEVDSLETAIKLLRKKRYRYYLTVGALHLAPPLPTDMHLALLHWIPTYPVFPNNDMGKTLQRLWDIEMAKLIRRGELAQLYRRYGLYDFFKAFIQDMEHKASKSTRGTNR